MAIKLARKGHFCIILLIGEGVICGSFERIVHMSPELRAMMNGVISALTTVFWGLPGCRMDQQQTSSGLFKKEVLGYHFRGYIPFKAIHSQYAHQYDSKITI